MVRSRERSVEADGEGDTFFFPEVLVDKMNAEDTRFDFGAARDTTRPRTRFEHHTTIAKDLKADLSPVGFEGFDSKRATAGEVVGFGESCAFGEKHGLIFGELDACAKLVEEVDGRPKGDVIKHAFFAKKVAVDDVYCQFSLFDSKASAQCAFGFLAKDLDAIVCGA